MSPTQKRNMDYGRLCGPFSSGDGMKQPQFRRLYDRAPEGYRAELIGGIVFEPAPPGYDHGASESDLSAILKHYAGMTDGVESVSNVSTILSDLDEVEPDVILRITTEFGGQSQLTNPDRKKVRRITGAPELVAEVAHTSRAIDLHLKKERYKLAGVTEYVVLCVDPLRLHWFLLQEERNLDMDADGIFRSRVFPGLWIDGKALLQHDYKKTLNVLNTGMNSSEYHTFADLLIARSK